MPKRGAIALALTTLALVLLFSFKTPDIGPIAAGRNTALVQPAASSAPAADRRAGRRSLAAASPATSGRPGANGAPAAPAASPAPGGGGTALANGTVTGSRSRRDSGRSRSR